MDKDALPSYFGKCCKISYKIVVSIDHPGSKGSIFEFPVNILSSYSPDPSIHLYPLRQHDILHPYSTFTDESKVHRLVHGPIEPSPKDMLAAGESLSLEMIVKYHENGSCKKYYEPFFNKRYLRENCFDLLAENQQPSNFEIRRDQQLIGRLTLSRSLYRPGEILVVSFNFSQADLTCFQLEAVLEEYETLSGDFSQSGLEVETQCSQVGKIEQIVWMQEKVSFRLGLKENCAPTTYTSMFTHKFRLLLGLWVADGNANPSTVPTPKWLGCTPDSPFKERFEFSVPITVLPFPPTNEANSMINKQF